MQEWLQAFATNGSPPPLSRIRQQLGMLQDAEDLPFSGGLRVQPQDAVGPRLFSGTDAPEDKSGSRHAPRGAS